MLTFDKKLLPTVVTAIGPKGGISKTTTISNLAGLLADLGKKVLVIDTDKQQSLSRQFLDIANEPYLPDGTSSERTEAPGNTTGLGEILYRGGIVHKEDIRPSIRGGIDVIVSNIGDEHIHWLKERMDAFSMFIRIISSDLIVGHYDYVLIDTQGSVNVIGKNAGVASDVILSPLPPNQLDVGTFIADAPRIWDEIDRTCEMINRKPPRVCVVYSKANFRLVNDQVMRQVIEPFIQASPRMELLNTVIPPSTIYTQATAMRVPVHLVDGSTKTGSPYDVMHQLMFELFPDLQDQWTGEPVANGTGVGDAA
ncbi:MAG: ParA family protein [Cytophagales bacterium]|nr:ParA family protein [Cytophagales bacterium]